MRYPPMAALRVALGLLTSEFGWHLFVRCQREQVIHVVQVSDKTSSDCSGPLGQSLELDVVERPNRAADMAVLCF